MAQRRRRQERPRRRWRLRRGSQPAAPRSSRRSLAPPARLRGAPPGSAWLRRPVSLMRLGGRRASAAAATTAPSEVGSFEAAPGVAPVPFGGGCRLRDDPPGHAEAAAAAAGGERGVARSRARWPSASGEGPSGSPLARRTGRPAAAAASTALLLWGISPFTPGPPGGWRRVGVTRPRATEKPSPRPRFRRGRVYGAGGWRRHCHPLGWAGAVHVHPGGRQRTLVCKQPWLSAPHTESRRVPGGGAGEQGGNWSAESERPRKLLVPL